jgi:hypothetical protein
MWNPVGAGTGCVGAGYAPNVRQSASVPVTPEVVAVKGLVNTLFDTTGAEVQMAQRLSSSLKELQTKVGAGTFYNDLNKLIHTLDVCIASLAAVRQSMQHLFPDAGDSSQPGPAHDIRPAPRFKRQVPLHPAHLSHNAATQRVSVYDPYTDTSNPGRKPGVGNQPGNIWSGFKQGPTKGNCVTVSAIKCAMMKFGQKPTDIYKQVIASGDGWDIQMRDNQNRWYHLSKTELAQATFRSEFSGDSPAMLADANFLYAVSAKRAQIENNDGYASAGFESALFSLNDQEDGDEGLLRLGLGAHIQPTTVQNLARGQLGVVTHGIQTSNGEFGHSLAVINGREDVFGTQGGYPPTNVKAHAFALV